MKMPIPTVKHVNVPAEVVQRLRNLYSDFQDGDITKKGYCKKKWTIIKDVVPTSAAEGVHELMKSFDHGAIAADVYYDKLMVALEEICVASMNETNLEKPDIINKDLACIRDSNESVAKSDVEMQKLTANNGSDDVTEDSNLTVTTTDIEMKDVITPGDGNGLPLRVPKRRSSRFSNPKDTPVSSRHKIESSDAGVASTKESSYCAINKEQPTILSMFGSEKSKPSSFGGHSKQRIESNVEEKQPNLSKGCTLYKRVDIVVEENQGKVVKKEEEDIVVEKKQKLSENSDSLSIKRMDDNATVATELMVPPKCPICKQMLRDNSDLHLYGGHPKDAVEEEVALVDPRLSLFTGDEIGDVDAADERPQNKITCFSVFDQEGHLCPFDSGLIERNMLLYFSGYVKAIYVDNKDIEGGIPTKNMGPINEWWISGFDGGELALIGFSTAFGEYVLMEPSNEYAPFMTAVKEKIFMSKVVIEFLCGARGNGGDTYEDLLNTLQTTVPPENVPPLTEDGLLRHAQFVCEQVLSFDNADTILQGGDSNTSNSSYGLLLTSPCMRSLIKLAGVTFGKRRAMRRNERKDLHVKKCTEWTKATTTPLVKEVFEMFFREQIDVQSETKGNAGYKRRRCGICEACQQPDCGTCISCKDMVKFGGTGRSKQACITRKCPNMAIQEAEDSEPEDEDKYQVLAEDNSVSASAGKTVRSHSVTKKAVTWIGYPIFKDDIKTYYKEAQVEGVSGNVELGCHVLVQTTNPSTPYFVARVNSMWEDKNGRKMFHAVWFCRGSETVLGETADPVELFSVDECEDISLRSIAKKTVVHKYIHPRDWAIQGGVMNGSEIEASIMSGEKTENIGEILWFQKRYDKFHGRFEDLAEDPPCPKKGTEYRFCASCERLYQLENKEIPKIDEKLEEVSKKNEMLYGVVYHLEEEYRRGMFVFIDPMKASLKSESAGKETKKKDRLREQKVDEEMYPEFYRKFSSVGVGLEHNIKGSNVETPAPFIIGMITDIGAKQTLFNGDPRFVSAADIWLDVNLFYRPEDTHRGFVATHQADLNLLYWTQKKCRIFFKAVAGKCEVVYGENVEGGSTGGPRQWSTLGPNRFYFLQAYDPITNVFSEPPPEARAIGKLSKGKGKGKGKAKKEKLEETNEEKPGDWPHISQPLRSLDVFAGCGGLSEGLHQSGVACSHWAIEKEEAAAHAFRLNNPNCTVFTDDCNALLRLVMDGEKVNKAGQRLPQKGEVELLCGGPPCQGFSGMNRFNSRQYSLFKNSLIASYLSYCDYYRPRFFILENVRNFVSFKRSMVLKLTLRCLLRMGYQCSFGVLQAGNYGVPQTRRRAIILAAAPGELLPKHPSPTHVFNPKACQLTVMVDDKRFEPDFRWQITAPLRTITVRDAMSDLPEIRNGSRKDDISYGGEPLSHFQRQMRGNQDDPVLRDHICKEMAPVVEARMAHIPTASGSDWRDLPNIVVRLCDGTYTKKLVYSHHDKKNGRGPNGALRGVCTCATGKGSCDPMDRQFNTLIPWCLPHTGNRHNHWAGLYGRLEWDGFFSTTITNPEPMGKQGRVLHPEQTRVVSVRECARSQGFRDTYRFYGSILDKHRQVGNAVPPPMGAAIGHELRKCVTVRKHKASDQNMQIAG